MKDKDHEVSMAKTQVKKSIANLQKVARVLASKTDDDNLPAWLQAKLTDTEHNSSAAADYMGEGKPDRKGQVINVKTEERKPEVEAQGKKVAGYEKEGKYKGITSKFRKDNPGSRQPKKDRGAKPSEGERQAAQRSTMNRLQAKYGRTTKQKREAEIMAKHTSTRDHFEPEGSVIQEKPGDGYLGPTPIPNPIRLAKDAVDAYNRKQQKTVNTVNQSLGRNSASLSRVNYFNPGPSAASKRYLGLNSYDASNNIVGGVEVISEAGKKCWKGYKKTGTQKIFGKTYNRCEKENYDYSNWRDEFQPTVIQSINLIEPEPLVSEKKDACYHKVKSRYSVWPSAYASGALVKCRKVGAKNWGNSKKEEFEYELNEGWVVNTAAQYFIEQGLNEEGVAILTEEMGLDDFVEFVFDLGEETMITEARAGGVKIKPVTAKGQPFKSGKPSAKSIERLRRLKADRREAEAKASAARPSGMKAALQSQSKTTKKREQAVKSAKSQQPKKRGILDTVAKQVLKGIDRHNAAMARAKSDLETTKKIGKHLGKGAREFGKGFKSGVTTAGKVAKVAHKLATEAAPPGDKYERMIRHIKKNYAKDGNLTDRERSIAYATAWKQKGREEQIAPKGVPAIRGISGKKLMSAPLDLRTPAEKMQSVKDQARRRFGEDVQEASAAWTRKAGKNPSGGLNEKGRKSYERENPGSDLKRPSKKVGNERRASFCARMQGMKKRLTSAKTANDPNSRINKSLRAWNC